MITNSEWSVSLEARLRSQLGFVDPSLSLNFFESTTVFESAIQRTLKCLDGAKDKYFQAGVIDAGHTGQYCTFLYFLCNECYRSGLTPEASAIYALNKALHGCDLFYEVKLPEVFHLDHPFGSVMGRASFGEFFSFGQNCTVGNNRGIYPIIGSHVKMCAGSMILGDSKVGDNVVIGAGAIVKDDIIPANSLVFGQSPGLIIRKRQSAVLSSKSEDVVINKGGS